ncbi:MAG TPA: DedA family protein [Holophagaceae bacterium]|jgi:membrane-associated protein|nr:DedA family protein [Holophagaceae bacterium]
MDMVRNFIHFLQRLTNPQSLAVLTGEMGLWVYVLMFAIVFCETGLVVMPFLPGDSLLFALGALGAVPGIPMNLWLMGGLLILAAFLGDALNYAIGRRLGPAVFHRADSRWLNRKHLEAAHAFYEKYGGKTIILARFVPIVRTFAPFVAGIGRMHYPRFAAFNLVGAILWVGSMMGAGRIFGGIPWVQQHFEAVIVAIIVISVLPAAFEFIRAKWQR